jgi:hypothetical protein
MVDAWGRLTEEPRFHPDAGSPATQQAAEQADAAAERERQLAQTAEWRELRRELQETSRVRAAVAPYVSLVGCGVAICAAGWLLHAVLDADQALLLTLLVAAVLLAREAQARLGGLEEWE